MTILDANVLLYAYDADAPEQSVVGPWLDRLVGSGEIIGLPWVTIWAFLRISTNSRLWRNPRTVAEAFLIIGEWRKQPGVIVLSPGPLHTEILEKLVREHAATGPLVTDAVIAALAIENGAALASTDQDFHRFPQLRWINPLRL